MNELGIDVSKSTLGCAYAGRFREFPNTVEGFQALEDWVPDARIWCMEATGRFHEPLARFAYLLGKRCLVVNPGRAKKYLAFVDARAKTDRVDALSLARLAEKEGEEIRPYKPVPELIQQARDLLTSRKALIESRVSLEQVAGATGDPEGSLAKVIESIQLSIAELERQLARLLKPYPSYKNLLTIPGIGPLSAAVLVCALERGEFATSDSLVAFAGLDPKPRDSGKHKGKRALSHQGEAQIRTLLFMAARAGARSPVWKSYYASQKAKGLSSTEATVILARKLIRVAWSVHKQKSPFIQKNGPNIDYTT